MSERSTGHHHSDASRYEIRIQGHLGSRWAAWFDGLSLTNEPDGTTLISGLVVARPPFMACFTKCVM